jgi:hypothetical protein
MYATVDCFYFSMATVTTVGFGDLTPNKNFPDQLFTVFYSFWGIAFIGLVVSELGMVIGQLLKQVEKEILAKAIRSSNHVIATGMGTKEKEEVKKAGSSSRIVAFCEDLLSETEEEAELRGTAGWYAWGLCNASFNIVVCW